MNDLDCKKGGLVTSCHKNLCDGVSDLANKSLTTTHVHSAPLINPCCAVGISKTFLTKSNQPNKKTGKTIDSEQKRNLMIQDLWEKCNDCILYMRVLHLDAPSHLKKTQEKSLAVVEMKKKHKYLESCLQKQCHF